MADRGGCRETTRGVTATLPPRTAESPPIYRQRLVLGVLVAAIILADQTTKWWAWRHSATVTINSGGDELVGGVVGSWFRATAGGALLDIVDSAALVAAMAGILRRRRPVPVLLSAALFVAGWISNLSDRLGLHYWTAPGSVRGAVDFLRLSGGAVYNGADVVIVVGATCLFASLWWYRRDRGRWRDCDAANPPRSTAIRPALALAGLAAVTVLACYGVTHAGFMNTPARLWPTE